VARDLQFLPVELQFIRSRRGNPAFWCRDTFRDDGPLSRSIAREANRRPPTLEMQSLVANLVLCAHARVELPDVRILFRRGAASQPHAYLSAANHLLRLGLMEQEVGEFMGLERCATEMWPTPKFEALCAEHRPSIILYDAAGRVLMRAAEGRQFLELEPDEEMARMQELLDQINEVNGEHLYLFEKKREERGGGGQGRALSLLLPSSSASSSRRLVQAPGSRAPAMRSASTLLHCGHQLSQLSKHSMTYRRIFHEAPPGEARWGKHGRFYAPVQSLSGAERLSLRIDGEPVVSLDFSGMHPTILYNREGLAAPADPYTMPGLLPELRATYKKATLIVLNAASRSAAAGALQAAVESGECPPPPGGQTVGDVLDQMEAAHAPVAGHFYKRTGDWVMNLDARIAEDVFRAFVLLNQQRRALDPSAASTPVIGVHDGFLTVASHERFLYRAMVRAYRSVMGWDWTPRIKKDIPGGSGIYVTEATYARD
jgi:hypothetical protein